MVSKLELKSSGPRLFPGREEYGFAFQSQYCKPPLKNQCGEREDLRPGGWEGGKGGRVVRLGG